MPSTATITSKGQVTIPREMRKILDSRTVEFEVINGEIRIRSVRSMASALSHYAGDKPAEPFSAVREKVWNEVADEQKK